jgi:hypothetical protein
VPAAAEHRPDVALRDIDLPGAGGPAAPANWPGAGLDAVGLTESMRCFQVQPGGQLTRRPVISYAPVPAHPGEPAGLDGDGVADGDGVTDADGDGVGVAEGLGDGSGDGVAEGDGVLGAGPVQVTRTVMPPGEIRTSAWPALPGRT